MGRRFEPRTHEVSIGRADTWTMCVKTDQVSRKHATVQAVLGKYYVVDLRSTNGTFVNEQKVERAKLLDGDQIRVGKTVLKYTESHVEQRYFEHVFNLASMDALTGAFTNAIRRNSAKRFALARPFTAFESCFSTRPLQIFNDTWAPAGAPC